MTKPGRGIALKESDWKLMSERLKQSKDLCISSRKRSRWEHDKVSILIHHSKAAVFYCWCCLLVSCTLWNIVSLSAVMCNSFLRCQDWDYTLLLRWLLISLPVVYTLSLFHWSDKNLILWWKKGYLVANVCRLRHTEYTELQCWQVC